MTEDEKWQNLLRDALVVLSLSPDDQIRVTRPGCVVCDLLEDYDHAHRFAIETAGTGMSKSQTTLLTQIDEAIESMAGLDVECSNEDAIRRPKWQELRELAGRALQEFGWTGARITPFVQDAPGVWRHPPQ